MESPRRALVSVSNKDGVVELARGLVELGFEVVSTGGTMKTLSEAGVPVTAVSRATGVPEILGGRVKTLHPTIFGGILARREMSEDMATLGDHGMPRIDVVAVNLYPFESTIAMEGVSDAEAIEQIDIGGPSLLRAAAKNHRDVFALVDPADYPEALRVLGEAREADGRAFRRRLAAKVFEHCSAYDRAIAAYLMIDSHGTPHPGGDAMPSRLAIGWPLRERMRYGENPHQAAAFYADPNAAPPSLAHCRQLQGKELSYNNYLDGDAALEMIRDFEEPACVILKHANPCGAGRGATLEAAYRNAFECDPVSAFGGIVGLNRPLDIATAEAMKDLFLEVVIAPDFEPAAVEVFAKKKSLRLLACGPLSPRVAMPTYRSVSGGMLAQTADADAADADAADRRAMTVVTKAAPTEEDWDALLFAWKVVRWVKSNAIVYATRDRTLGVGAGQMSRIDAARFGMLKAQDRSPEGVRGAYLASDGFFPFRDVVDLVAAAGVRAIIQPGGSVRDEESIAAANEHGIPMILAGRRHFRH